MYLDEKPFTDPSVETKLDIYALPTFIAWLEKHLREQTYDWKNCKGECLISLYMVDHGIPWNSSEDGHSYSKFVCRTEGDWQIIASCQPWTFGAALSRARVLLANG